MVLKIEVVLGKCGTQQFLTFVQVTTSVQTILQVKVILIDYIHQEIYVFVYISGSVNKGIFLQVLVVLVMYISGSVIGISTSKRMYVSGSGKLQALVL